MSAGNFEGIGLKFQYPENWTTRDEIENGNTVGVTIESPESVFFSVVRYAGQRDDEALLTEARQAMEGEYKELEIDEGTEKVDIYSIPTVYLRFYLLDLLVVSQILAIPTSGDTLLVQIQGEDRDFERLRPVFKAMLLTLIRSLPDAAALEDELDDE